jgi:hypothetical protein
MSDDADLMRCPLLIQSGHLRWRKGPNAWLHRPSLRREDSPYQLRAVHTFQLSRECPLLAVTRRCWTYVLPAPAPGVLPV